MKWISVKDKLPEYDKPVLAYGHRKGYLLSEQYNIYTASYDLENNIEEGWEINPATCNSFALYNVTHWMPLPEKPE